MSESKIFLLYVDDEQLLLDLAKAYLERTGDFIIDTVTSAKEALKLISGNKYDAVISDYQMPETDGLEFLRSLRSTGNNIPFIIFTGKGREEVAIEALNAGADYYLQKGGMPKVQFGELQNFITHAVKKRRAEKAILEHERRMAEIIDFLPDATFAIDTDGKVIAWNKALENLTGIMASDITGKNEYRYSVPFYKKQRPLLIDIVLNRELAKEVSYDSLKFEGEDRISAEIFLPDFKGGDGTYFWFTASPLYDTEGNVSGAIESIRDVTEFKMTEGLYTTIFEDTGTAMMIVDDNIQILNANEKMRHLLGLSKNESKKPDDLQPCITEEDREKLLKYHSLLKNEPEKVPENYECRVVHKDGSIKTTLLNGAIIPGTNKTIISLIDITEQKKAEKLLRFTKFSVDNAPDGILWADENGRIFAANQSAVRMYGYPEEELTGLKITDFAPDFPEDRFSEFWEKAKDNGCLKFEADVLKEDRTVRTVELNIVFLNFEGQDYECGFARDITDRKNSGDT
ncbi:PAS domain S-box-containing protein [Methanomicrobium sp. W14]|uniref:PAS domain S-box protein n=1 Tax=Methanomicrobium sp. W14 TaxID=2817839 RepID=UPI001AE35088|nr:PAS domain S-box protein [Methanomicrobium sp. W14]MBP2132406.1 PAS domain S-box-containing protein [Methanomicrobium sp. W14]